MSLSDTFVRPDSATSLGTASDGGSYTVVGGTHGILSNRGYLATASGGTVLTVFGSATYVAVRDTGVVTADLTLDLNRLTTASNSPVLVVGYDPATHNGVAVVFGGNNSTGSGIYRTDIDSAINAFATSRVTGWASGSFSTIRVTFDATTRLVTVYQGGVSKYTGTAPARTYGTYVGFGDIQAAVTGYANLSAVTPAPPAWRPPAIVVRSRAVTRSSVI